MLTDIFVVPSTASDELKSGADFACTGSHDEITIQQAIDKAAKENKNILLANGIYRIDGFHDFGDGGPLAALCFPNNRREYIFKGQNSAYSGADGVQFYLSRAALDTIEDREYDANANDPAKNPPDVIRTTWLPKGISAGSALVLENIRISLSHNKKPIRCVDLRRCDRIEVKNLKLSAIRDMNAGFGKPPTVPIEGCIGLTATDGSNNSYANFTDVGACGFYEGIQLSGEHVVLINCNAIMCYYGYTFGNYGISCGANHPITLINCMDERNVCLPLFNSCGDSIKGTNTRMQGLQEVTMISFNMERIASQTPGGVLGDCMREVYPGTWRGNIDFTLQPAWHHLNDPTAQLWENDGSGVGIRTRNLTHKSACTTEERLSYTPTYMQQVFDTDLGKLLICVDPAEKKWVDAMGSVV